MSSLNKVQIIGNLGRDPEIRNTQDGKKVATLSVATSESWKDKSGERKEKTEWHRVVIWGDGLCGVVEQYLKKGSKVYLEGQIETRKWTDVGSDITKYSTEIVIRGFAGNMVMLDGKKESDYAPPADKPEPGGADLDDGHPF